MKGLLLPGHTDGIGLIERLKTDQKTRDIPVIVVTCCAWTSERTRAERGGCDVFLSKPCLPDDLAREVRRLLAASMAKRRRLTDVQPRSPRSGSNRSHPSDSTSS